MHYDAKEIIEQLKLEIKIIERGGYSPSVREPHEKLRIFRDSASCPNLALEEKAVPCAHCWLSQFLPLEHMNAAEPCHYIALNSQGDTVASLTAEGRDEFAQQELLKWLRNAVERMERELVTPTAT